VPLTGPGTHDVKIPTKRAGNEMNANLSFGRNAAKNMLNPLVSWCRGGYRQASGI